MVNLFICFVHLARFMLKKFICNRTYKTDAFSTMISFIYSSSKLKFCINERYFGGNRFPNQNISIISDRIKYELSPPSKSMKNSLKNNNKISPQSLLLFNKLIFTTLMCKKTCISMASIPFEHSQSSNAFAHQCCWGVE